MGFFFGRGRRLGAITVFALAALAVLVLPVVASAQTTRGAISGTVRDTSGAVVPGVTITVTNVDTNVPRSEVTDAQGFYRVGALEPGKYNVRAELAGFAPTTTTDVVVTANKEVSIDVSLKVATVGEEVTVVGESTTMELNKVNPTIGMTANAKQVVELPLPGGRNLNNLVLTAPNVSSSNGQGTYVVNGQRSRNNNYMIDGSDNNDISVTISTSQIVPEAVAEFQVQTNPYNVEFGRNTGAQINVITKSGTNAFRGDAWDYYTNSKQYSLTNIEKASGLTKPAPFHRHQAGGDFGGPIIKDKTFFYGLFQWDGQRPGETPGASVRIPTPAGWAALQNVPLRAGQSPASRAAVLNKLSFVQDLYNQGITFRTLQNINVNGVPIQTGLTNVNIVAPSTYKSYLARVDHRLSNSDNATFRYSYTPRIDNNAISNCAFGSLFCGYQDLKDTNLAASETHIFTSRLLNEFRYSLVRRNLDFPENDPTSPTANVGGLGITIGGLSNFPQSRISNANQFSDVLTWTREKHTFKFGADIRYNKLNNEAAFDSKGTFTFASFQDYINNIANPFQQALQTASFVAKQWQTYWFAQDDFRITPDLTVNMGLRYELSGAPLGFFGATDPQSLAALVPPPVKEDKNNWAPRAGFAWSPRGDNKFFGDGKTVFRGGFGVGYDVLFYNLLTVNASNYPRVVVPQVFNALDVYPNTVSVSGAPVFNPLATYVNSAENTQNPRSNYYSFDMQREFGNIVLQIGYTGSKCYHGINQIEMNPAVLTDAQAALVASTKNPNAIPGVQARRLYPQFGSRITIPTDVGPGGNDTEARSSYNGMFVAVNKRYSHGLQIGGSYTYSKMMSNNDASLGEGSTAQTPQVPQDYFNYGAEWSVSAFDRPHRFTMNYIWEIPGPKTGILGQVIGGWQISGVTQGQSGQPFTIRTGVDSNGNSSTGGDRPNFDPSGSVVWDSNHRQFTNNGYFVTPLGTSGAPLQYAQGNGDIGRNSMRTAAYFNTDLALSKRFTFAGTKAVQVRAEGYNVFNQDNYGVPVNAMNSASFGQNTNNWGRRTFTFAAKFIW